MVKKSTDHLHSASRLYFNDGVTISATQWWRHCTVGHSVCRNCMKSMYSIMRHPLRDGLFPLSSKARDWALERCGQCGASEWASCASEQVGEWENGPITRDAFMVILLIVLCTSECERKCVPQRLMKWFLQSVLCKCASAKSQEFALTRTL